MANDYLLSDRAFFFFRKEYSPLYNSFRKDSSTEVIVSLSACYNNILNSWEDNKNKCIDNTIGLMNISLKRPKYGFDLFYNYNSNYLKMLSKKSKGITRNRQKLNMFGLNAWFRKEIFFGGVKIITNVYEKYSHTSIYSQSRPEIILNNPKLDYALALGLHYKNLRFFYELSKDVTVASKLSYVLKDYSATKTAPFSMHTLKNQINIIYSSYNITNEFGFAFRKISSDFFIESPDSIEPDININHFDVNINGDLLKKLAWRLTYQSLRSQINTYESSYNFFYIKNFILHRILCQLEYTLKNDFTLYLFEENIKGTFDKGKINFAPFSSWTIFFPKAYKLYDFKLKYNELGIALEKSISLGLKNKFSIGLSTSYILGYLGTKRKEQKILVLVPVYVNEKTVVLEDFHDLSIVLKIGHRFTCKNFSINSQINQLVPFWFRFKSKGGTVFSCDVEFWL